MSNKISSVKIISNTSETIAQKSNSFLNHHSTDFSINISTDDHINDPIVKRGNENKNKRNISTSNMNRHSNMRKNINQVYDVNQQQKVKQQIDKHQSTQVRTSIYNNSVQYKINIYEQSCNSCTIHKIDSNKIPDNGILILDHSVVLLNTILQEDVIKN